jgi:uncharacterized protein involved in exopolysaccharide biosynthesis
MMTEIKEEYYSLGDISNLIKSFFFFLLKKWWILLIAVIGGAGAGMILYNTQKPKYEAVCSFILEEKSGGGSGLAGLASQFGFDIGGMTGGGSIFTGDNILNILTSKKVVHSVLLSPVDDTGTSGKTLADLYLALSKKDAKKKDLNTIDISNLYNTGNPQKDSILNAIYESVVKKNLQVERVSKQGSIIKVQVTAADQDFARLMTERLVEEARKLYFDIRLGTAQENIRSMQRRSDSLLMLLNNKSYRAAASMPLDLNPGIRTGTVPGEIATRDKTVLATLYAEVTKNLEASKLMLSQQTPVIQVLDRPGHFLEDNKRSMPFMLVIAAFAAFVFVVIALLLPFISGFLKRQQNLQSIPS